MWLYLKRHICHIETAVSSYVELRRRIFVFCANGDTVVQIDLLSAQNLWGSPDLVDTSATSSRLGFVSTHWE